MPSRTQRAYCSKAATAGTYEHGFGTSTNNSEAQNDHNYHAPKSPLISNNFRCATKASLCCASKKVTRIGVPNSELPLVAPEMNLAEVLRTAEILAITHPRAHCSRATSGLTDAKSGPLPPCLYETDGLVRMSSETLATTPLQKRVD
ncbi:hypothetical protein E4U39_007696, partial [Claviceps sp. Clav50 group G5]